ncbi:ATP-dependent helicase [Candidatus Falkowbacteria bacterium]|nr:ATP-dependent helicase [Candidatus Falkowbacteria bacterium]
MNEVFEFNSAQKRAIEHDEGPLLIVAGAGTGKTRVITNRFISLMSVKKLGTDEILAMTFTEKAAEEMESRVLDALPLGYTDLWISTFHAFCDKILRKHGLDIGLGDNYRLLDETESWLLVRKNLDRFNLDYYRPLGNPTKFIHALLKHFSRCQDEEISAADYSRYAENLKLNNDAADFVKKLDLDGISESEKKELFKSEILRIGEIANAYHVYQQILLENNFLDFGGLINWTARLFRERPLILAKYRQQFKYILIDEFQDTNSAQYALIKLLAAPKNNLTVVGDDDQSIYKFRGASISNIMQFKEDFASAKEIVLTENYRSRQEILDLAYKFIIQNNPYRLEAKLGIDKKLVSRVDGAAEIVCFHERTAEDEARAVLRKILELRAAQQAEWSEFAILVRANDSANLFINFLEQAGVPYQFCAWRGLYNKPIVLDLLNYLKLLDDYHEPAAVFRVLNFDFWGIEQVDINKITYQAKKQTISLYEAMREAATIVGISAETLKRINQIICQIEHDSRLAKEKKASEVLLSFLHQSGYLEQLKSKDEKIVQENLNYLQQFFKKIQKFEAANPASKVADFLELARMEQEAGESGKLAFDENVGPDMVRIMTIHGAKGLEFNYVFIPNLVDRKFPTDERKEAIEIPDALVSENLSAGDFHLEEERRLFYVAMTRAKKGLFFSFADDYGGSRKRKPSCFLFELGFEIKESEVVSALEMTNKTLISPSIAVNKIDSLSSRESSFKLPWVTLREPQGDTKYAAPRRFSFSQMQMYESCPLRYKFAHILHIPIAGNFHFSFGNSMHETLRRFVNLYNEEAGAQLGLFGKTSGQEKKVPELERLFAIYEQSWIPDWYESEKQKQMFYQKGKESLKKFHQQFENEKPNVKFIEHPFNLKIGDYTFAGRIDRIDELENRQVEIIDYKTGEAKGDNLAAEDKRQLLLYQIAVEELLRLNLNRLFYYYLDAGVKIPFIGEEADKKSLKERFVQNVKKIENNEFAPTPAEFICRYCEFRGICEYKKIRLGGSD